MANPLHQYDYYLMIVLARKKLFLTVALTVMTIGVIIAYTLPPKFEAESTVFLEENVITDLVKGIAVTPSVESKIKMLSVALLSRTMLLKVLTELDKDLALKTDRQQEEYLADLTKRITISYKEKERVFRISLRDKDPVFARDFVNTLTRKYIDDNTSSKREESLDATKFLAEQIETFKKRIDAAEDAINKFKSEKGYILAADDVFLRGEIGNAEKKLEELSIKRSELEAKKHILQEHGPDGPVSDKLSEAESRLSELLSRYTDDNPKVLKAKEEVARLKSGKVDRVKNRPDSTSKDNIEMLQAEIDSYKEMEAHEARVVEESKNLLRDMPNVKAALAELVRKKDNEGVVYQQLVSRYGQSEVSKQMELEDKSITYRILDPAVKPIIPVSPNRLLIIMGSVVAGFGFGFGLILLLDIIKGGIKSPAELKDFDIPVFAIVPHIPDLSKDAMQRRQDRTFLCIAAGYFMVILLFATADVLHLSERSSATRNLISSKITGILHRN
jgi:polysaccharide chain length determinant protein (PEP-CTERM system associated)